MFQLFLIVCDNQPFLFFIVEERYPAVYVVSFFTVSPLIPIFTRRLSS